MIAGNPGKSNLKRGFKSMVQIKWKKTRGLVITCICAAIVLAIAMCVVLAGFYGFDQSKSVSFNPFQKTFPRGDGENPAHSLFWQGEKVSLNCTATAVQNTAGRLPTRYTNSRYNTLIALPSSISTELLGITSSFAGITNTILTTASVCILLLVDIPPPYPEA